MHSSNPLLLSSDTHPRMHGLFEGTGLAIKNEVVNLKN